MKDIQCSYCGKRGCVEGDLDSAPAFCPSRLKPEVLAKARLKLEDSETSQMAQDVARTWKDLGSRNRIELTMDYAKVRGYKRLGLAFCTGLAKEAKLLTNILRNEGFEVLSACCMCGALCSDDAGLPEADKIMAGARQPMCNPIGQAALLDEGGSELNIMLGLCVGDDVLFIKHSKAPVTVIAVKDYALAHNPLGALYMVDSFFSRLNAATPKP